MLSRRRIRLSPEDIAADVQAIRRKAGIDRVATNRTRLNVPQSTPRRWLWSGSIIAAAILAVSAIRSGSPHKEGITRTYATITGQQRTFTLSDGTEVTMGPQSTLRLFQFGGSSRTVALDGQAYFNVVHRGTAPFAVRSGDITTRVLGTTFMVQHYASDTHVRVAVAEGKVAVANTVRRTEVTLRAGDIGDVHDSTLNVTTVRDLAPETGWMHDRLVFNDAPIKDVLATLSRWYGYEFQLTDSSMAHRNVTIALSTRSSAEALVVLEKVLHVSLAVNGRTVILTPTRLQRDVRQPRVKAYDTWTPNREVGR